MIIDHNILVVEDDDHRILTFIEYLGGHNLKIVDSIKEAKYELSHTKYDYLFLTNAVGLSKDSCMEIINFIYGDLLYQPFILLHSLDIVSVDKMRKVIPEARWKPIGSNEFYFLI